jgi:NAD(P)-dependent dehydrogenase (short-subunit alcohol dehydrogenase family)
MVSKLDHPIRGLVACAGVSDNGPATEFPAEAFRRLLDINGTGTILVAQAVACEVAKAQQTSASMVLVASMSGYVSNRVGWGIPVPFPLLLLCSARKGHTDSESPGRRYRRLQRLQSCRAPARPLAGRRMGLPGRHTADPGEHTFAGLHSDGGDGRGIAETGNGDAVDGRQYAVPAEYGRRVPGAGAVPAG